MVLVIAEKPSLARDIADAIPGIQKKEKDRILVGDYCITWVFGHILTLKDPEDYDQKYADRSNLQILPIYFPDWDVKPRASDDGSAEERLKLIGNLLKQADYVIHAGDPDEEGQLLIDEILRWFQYNGQVKRLATGNTTKPALEKALRTMTDNKQSEANGWSAYARSVADFMVGINLTRYFSTLNSMSLPVGRVKMPTLGLVIARDEEFENHQKVIYYELFCDLVSKYPPIRVKYVPDEADAALVDGRILDKQLILDRKVLIAGLKGEASVTKEPVKSKPPLPFNLVKLQSYCSSHFGYDPEETLEITQSLRQKYKAITYNRSDCQYLSEEHFKEAPETIRVTLANLGKTYPELDPTIKSKCFNNKYITAHFAIIPSGEPVNLEQFTERERNVYIAIANRYLIQFMPPAEKEKTTITMDTPDGGTLKATSTIILKQGFIAITKEDEEEAEASDLSKIPSGTYQMSVENAEEKECETKPRPRYTKASLNEDMTRIAKFVDNAYIRQLLLEKDEGKEGENGSIGTSATRSMIIEDIIRLGYVREEGKKLISTPKGREFYRILPDEFKKADLTAVWWVTQEDIKAGEASPADLTAEVLQAIQKVLDTEYPKIDPSLCTDNAKERVGTCPLCGAPVIVGKKGYGCSNWKSGCPFVLWKEGKGVFSKIDFTKKVAKTLLAGEPVYTQLLWSEKKKNTFPGKITLVKDTSQKYGYQLHISMEQETLGKCPVCNADVVEGKLAYGCSNWKECSFRIWKKAPDGSLYCKTKFTPALVKKLLTCEQVDNITMYSKKNGSTFKGSAKLEYDAERGSYEIKPVFQIHGEFVGVCPRCGGNVVETGVGYFCENSRSGCDYKFFKQAKQGLMSKTTITPAMAQALILGKHIEVKNLFSAKKNKTFTGVIYFDDTQLSSYGPQIRLDMTTNR